MPRTRDTAPLDGVLDIPDCGLQPTNPGELTNDGGDIYAQDTLGVFNIRQQGDPDLILTDCVTCGILIDSVTGNVVTAC